MLQNTINTTQYTQSNPGLRAEKETRMERTLGRTVRERIVHLQM